MNWEFAHTAALVIAGNTFLQAGDIGSFWPDAPVFVFTREVTFVSRWARAVVDTPRVAADPRAWFDSLRGDGRGLVLRCPWLDNPAKAENQDIHACRYGPPAFIEAIGLGGVSAWMPEYSRNLQSESRKSASFIYRESGEPAQRAATRGRDTGLITRDFEERLRLIAAFSDGEGLDVFSNSFRRALELLRDGDPPRRGWEVDNVEGARLPLHARQWLAACSASSVYGGMGSWNDRLYPAPQQEEFVRVTRALYQIQVEAAVAAINTSCAAL